MHTPCARGLHTRAGSAAHQHVVTRGRAALLLCVQLCMNLHRRIETPPPVPPPPVQDMSLAWVVRDTISTHIDCLGVATATAAMYGITAPSRLVWGSICVDAPCMFSCAGWLLLCGMSNPHTRNLSDPGQCSKSSCSASSSTRGTMQSGSDPKAPALTYTVTNRRQQLQRLLQQQQQRHPQHRQAGFGSGVLKQRSMICLMMTGLLTIARFHTLWRRREAVGLCGT